MSDAIDIFLCYRKLKVEVAHDKSENERQNASAFNLFRELSSRGRYRVWMDEELQIGELYQKVIYKSLVTSDVFIIAVTNGVARSDWVRREISVAQAFGITLLPIGLDITEADLKRELTELRIDDHHFRRPLDTTSQTFGGQVDELGRHIASAAAFTRGRSHDIVLAASKKRQVKPRKAMDQLRSRQFRAGREKLSICITSGDVFRQEGIDVLVSSENNWLMMARPFDGSSISAQLRRKGTTYAHGRFVDNIQQQLDIVSGTVPKPAPIGYCATTGSGAPDSDLFVDNGIRHIIHLVGVQVDETDGSLIPVFRQDQIDHCLRNVFVELQKIIASRGCSAPPGSAELEHQQARIGASAHLRNVFIPLLGTGSAKGDPGLAAAALADGLLRLTSSNRFAAVFEHLEEIFVGAFFEEQLMMLGDELARRFQETTA